MSEYQVYQVVIFLQLDKLDSANLVHFVLEKAIFYTKKEY